MLPPPSCRSNFPKSRSGTCGQRAASGFPGAVRSQTTSHGQSMGGQGAHRAQGPGQPHSPLPSRSTLPPKGGQGQEEAGAFTTSAEALYLLEQGSESSGCSAGFTLIRDWEIPAGHEARGPSSDPRDALHRLLTLRAACSGGTSTPSRGGKGFHDRVAVRQVKTWGSPVLFRASPLWEAAPRT